MATTPWWEAAFSADYLDVYAHRSDQAAAEEIAGLLPRLLQTQGMVLDACCGNGRHLAALRRAGIDAYGFDLSAALLAAANRRPESQGCLARCDMRAPCFARDWGAILLLFTAFGYFDDSENVRCLGSFATMLRPGGWLVIDVPDPDHLRANLIPDSCRMVKDLTIVESRRIRSQRMEKDVRLERNGTIINRYSESVRLYSSEEMVRLAEQAGLQVVEVWPSLLAIDVMAQRNVYWMRRGVTA